MRKIKRSAVLLILAFFLLERDASALFDGKYKEASKKLEESTAAREKIAKEKKELEEKCSALEAENRALKEDRGNFLLRIKELTDMKVEGKIPLETAKKIEALKKENADLQKEIDRLKSKNLHPAVKETAVSASYNGAAKEYASKIKAMENEITALKKDKEAAERALELSNRDVLRAVKETTETSSYKDAVRNYLSKIKDMETEIMGLRKDKEAAEKALEAKTKDSRSITKDTSEVDYYKGIVKDYSLKIDEMKKEIAGLRQDKESAEKTLKARDLDAAQDMAEITSFKNAVKDYTAKMKQTDREMADLVKRKDAAEKSIDKARQEKEKAAAEEKKKYESALNKEKSKFESILRRAKKDASDDLKGMKKWETKAMSLEDQLRNYKKNYAEAERKNKAFEREIKNIPAKYAELARQNRVLIKDTSKMHYNIGVFYVKNKEFERAVHEFEKAVEINPDDAASYFNLGYIYAEFLVDRKRAIDSFKRYLMLAKEDDKDIEWAKKYILTWQTWEGKQSID